MKARLVFAAGFYLAALSIMAGMQMALEWSRSAELERQSVATLYAPVTNVRWQISGGRLLIVAGLSQKLEPCFVPAGAPVTLVTRWRDDIGPHFKNYPARRPDGIDVTGAPLVATGDEFVVGPFVIEDDEGIIAAIETVSVRLPCAFETGINRVATIGPINKPEI